MSDTILNTGYYEILLHPLFRFAKVKQLSQITYPVGKRHSHDWNPGSGFQILASSVPPTLLSSKQWLSNQKSYIQCMQNAFYGLLLQTSD